MFVETVIAWLLEPSNPAVAYRTQTELLGQSADKAPVVKWLTNFLPDNWEETKGLWFSYYLTAFSECGLKHEDTGVDAETLVRYKSITDFEYGCGDYMHLRALVRLGLGGHPLVAELINLTEQRLPDGGFLCARRKSFKYVPKSCVKANYHALLLAAECHKQGIKSAFEDDLLEYFWKHNIFYRTDNLDTLVLNARVGWRSIDTFHPFEVMRVGLHNIVEAFCALGYGSDSRLDKAWAILESKQAEKGRYRLDQTLAKSYLPKERVGKPSKWVTFYALLAQKERENNA
jgi:hypothetical protein